MYIALGSLCFTFVVALILGKNNVLSNLIKNRRPDIDKVYLILLSFE